MVTRTKEVNKVQCLIEVQRKFCLLTISLIIISLMPISVFDSVDHHIILEHRIGSHCSSILVGLPLILIRYLDWVLRSPAHLIGRIPKYASASVYMQDALSWFPVPHNISSSPIGLMYLSGDASLAVPQPTCMIFVAQSLIQLAWPFSSPVFCCGIIFSPPYTVLLHLSCWALHF